MPSTTVKRAAATVGVLAGLLAAAAPASAQLPPTGNAVTAPQTPTSAQGLNFDHLDWKTRAGAAPASPNDATTAALYSSAKSTFQEATGTQIGSEGVKAPKPSGVTPQGFYDIASPY